MGRGSDAEVSPLRAASPIDSAPLSGYSHEHRPLVSYAALSAVFNAGAVGFLVAMRRAGRPLPERLDVGDLLLYGTATHKFSRLLAKDRVTSFLRAPFTRYQGSAGPAEVSEEARGTGLQLALGELLICPYCLGQWVATGFLAGHAAAPRTARWVGGVFTTLAIADFLQIAYKAAQDAADVS